MGTQLVTADILSSGRDGEGRHQAVGTEAWRVAQEMLEGRRVARRRLNSDTFWLRSGGDGRGGGMTKAGTEHLFFSEAD